MRQKTKMSPEIAGQSTIRLAGEDFVADPSGALWHAGERMLVVADLHLEKGSSFARRGMMLPPYDTLATVAALQAAIERLQPKRVVALGDSFHDPSAHDRLGAAALDALASLQKGRDWIWIAGNHDPRPPVGLGGEAAAELTLGAVVFRHEPTRDAQGEIAGHLHPVARVTTRLGSVRRRCFASDGARIVLPAFGAYAGGLDLTHAAFAPLFVPQNLVAHVLGRDRIYRVPGSLCGL